MCSLVLSEQTVRFIQVMTTLPAEMHEKIGVFLNLASEGDKRATEILRMVGDDEIEPEEALGLLDEYLESRNRMLKPGHGLEGQLTYIKTKYIEK